MLDHCDKRRSLINNLTAKNLFQLDGKNPNFKITGDEGDISNLCQFGWFEWCYYCDSSMFLFAEEKLGRVLGPAKNHSNEMAQWVLKDTMKIVPWRTLRPLTDLEKRTQSIINEQNAFMDKCKRRYGDKLTVSATPFETIGPDDDDSGEFVPYEDETTPLVEMLVTEDTDVNGKFINMDHVMDNYINMEIRHRIGESEVFGKVIGASLDKDGKVIGSPNENPFLNTVLYNVEFEDGTCQQYGANIIA